MDFITLRNKNGLTARFTPYGARWVSLFAPDRAGVLEDVVLGFDTIDAYKTAGEQYHGAIVGRVCGRIANASFQLDGETFRLAENDVYGKPVRNHLHGGVHAFHQRMWNCEKHDNERGEESVVFTLFSPDGEEGYPGNVWCKVTYTLTHENSVRLRMEASCDRPTPINLTNHTFFQLNPSTERDVLRHRLQLNASSIIACDEELVPTGNLWKVAGSTLDFRQPQLVSDALTSSCFEIDKNQGFSLAFALDPSPAGSRPAVVLTEERSGRQLSIYTNQPSIQVYTGYFMDGSDHGKGGRSYGRSAGIALEAQGFPDALAHPEFPSIVISPSKPYLQETTYLFGVMD